jgi:hypothetical protein
MDISYNQLTLNNEISRKNSQISFHTAKKLYYAGIRFYRGIKTNANSFIQVPKERTSTSGKKNSNMVNRMVSEVLPSWTSYPRRTFCMCIGTSLSMVERYAGDTGMVYVAFPSDDALLAISPRHDFWRCFCKELNSDVNFIGEVFGLINEKYFNESFNLDLAEDIGKFFLAVDSIPNKEDALLTNGIINLLPSIIDDEPFHFLDGLAKAKKSKNFVEEYLNPDIHGFQLCNLNSDLSFCKGEQREVWTENPCLMIRADLVDSLSEEYFLKNMNGGSID